jgi:hypothetical protein
VWAEAAKSLNGFSAAVLTAVDTNGYPVSIRVDPHTYDPATGQLSAPFPAPLNAAEGPANLMCHYHDDKQWNIRSTQIKGRLEKQDNSWVFVSTAFDAPARLSVLSFITGARRAGQRYLDKRGLPRPDVDWAGIKELQRRAAG